MDHAIIDISHVPVLSVIGLFNAVAWNARRVTDVIKVKLSLPTKINS
jgi:hypothetical protein